ncbi:Flagellar hook-length control protein FliK [Rheinheimera pacifica]|uniref:Flagellar hook-length control protein FliK n=1 Tax=Rheinheimera pacifica TaxID=173990 RepID=A0A1H6MDG2_9GAMM|nr:flagellar hook-length control protein FliK [Rheinheimera pacifica]SEH99560.1 Flagellar hook-length control protein FliK [Rheinheimera pacifica]
MVQAIQLSMLTTSADSALRLDGALSDSAAEAGAELSGLGFGELLNGITQPATNGQSAAKLRHVPAGISVLNGVSQALLAAADAKGNAASTGNADTDSADNTDSAAGLDKDSLLTSSLLGQIALKDKLPETGSDTDAAIGTDTGAVAEDPATVLPGNVLSGNNQPEADAAKAVKTTEQLGQSANETTDIAADLLVKANSQTAGEAAPGKVTDKTEASAGGKGEAQPVAELSGAAKGTASLNESGLATEAGSDNQTRGSNNHDGAKAVTETAVKADDSTIKTDNNSTKSASVTQADTKPAAADTPAQMTAHTAPATGTADNSKTDADTDATTIKQPLTATADKTDNQAGGKAGSDQNASKHDAQNGSQQSSSQQSSSQQNSRQNNNSQQSADGSVAVPDSSIATAKVASDTSAAARSDTAFGNALHLAEQRQQASPAQTLARPLAEQLKQSLNLLQQDAAGQLRERVSLMVRQNIQIAEIRLDPAGLGQMQIKIDMQQDQASVQFIVQQSQAKELLEQQLPRLREMLQQQGIQLTEGQVQQQSQQERQLAQRDSNHSGRNGKHTADDNQDGVAETVQLNVKTSDRLVDYYA